MNYEEYLLSKLFSIEFVREQFGVMAKTELNSIGNTGIAINWVSSR